MPSALLILSKPLKLTNNAAHPATKTNPKRREPKEKPKVTSTPPSKAASTSGLVLSAGGAEVSSAGGGAIFGTSCPASSCEGDRRIILLVTFDFYRRNVEA